jgi:murein DD-endopeptidase MepM/ murein hydrolase activator NlpD
VIQGRKVGEVGSTGLSTGPHLHFGIFKNGKAVNPLDLLN